MNDEPTHAIQIPIPKVNREFTVIESDRVELIQEANMFIANISNRYMAACHASVPTEVTFQDEEMAIYRAALVFLKNQFDMGARDSETIETKTELEM